MATIRQMRKSDLERVEYICRMTAGPGARENERIGNIIAKTYATYYVREQSENCFVLADDNDTPVGYILTEPSCKRFKKIYRSVDVPAIKALDKKSGRSAWLIPIPYMLFGKKYPAHLHIDILEGYRSGGNGSKMMEMLLSKLKGKGVPGVMLILDAQNTGAYRFYERHGFHKIISVFGGIVMAKAL